MKRVYIAFGSNQDAPLAQLQLAREALAEHTAMQEIAASPIYRTPPWGYTEQPDFYNAVIAYDTALSPQALLELLQRIEAAQYRERPFKNAPRTLDLDLLLYADVQQNTPSLTLPHPRMQERAFVLEPLVAIAPEITIASYGKAADLLAALDCSGQEKIAVAAWDNFAVAVDKVSE